jgi:hypothetical protein
LPFPKVPVEAVPSLKSRVHYGFAPFVVPQS